MTTEPDVIIIGAGAAGLMCALQAGRRGRSVLLLDHATKLAEKIRISGGGRCNFTNLDVRPEHYLSENPHFCRSALARFKPQDFIDMLDAHGIGYSEKTLGQLFCDDKSEAVIQMLCAESDAVGVKRQLDCVIQAVKHQADSPHFRIETTLGVFQSDSLVIATGGLSIPKIGATPFGYQIAEQFGLAMVKPRAGLVPLTFAAADWAAYANLSGVSLPAVVSCGKQSFRENILITHRGLSGPAILQISSYWRPGQTLSINLLPDLDAAELFQQHASSQKLLTNFLAQWLPKAFVELWCASQGDNKPLNQYSPKQRLAWADRLQQWQVTPSGTLGYAKAEVTCGGVDTRGLSSKTMEALTVPGLFFIGEVVDVTGQLGGYNFQWAWASAYAAAQAV